MVPRTKPGPPRPDVASATALAGTPRTGALIVGVGLAIIAFTILARFPITNRDLFVQAGELVVLGYTIVRAAACIDLRHPRLVTLITWLWAYTIFGIVQIVQLSRAQNPFQLPEPDSLVSRQLVIVVVGLVIFDVVSSRFRAGEPKPDASTRQLSLTRTVVLSWLTVLASPLLIARLGGPSALLSSRLSVELALLGPGGNLTDTTSTSVTILVDVANVAPFLCLFSLVMLRRAGAYTFRARVDITVLTLALLTVNFFLNNPISQARFWIATVAVAVALSGRWRKRVGFQALFVAGYLLASLVLFPLFALTRYTDVSQATLPQSSVVGQWIGSTDYGSAQDVNNAIVYTDRHGHTDGRQLAGAALFFVPRSLWPGKPYDTARLIAVDSGFFQNLNLDSPLWAEGYIDFGYAGVVLVFVVFGACVGRGDRLATRLGTSTVWSILVPTLAGYELILLRGSLLQATGRLAVIIVIGYGLSRRARTEPAIPAVPGTPSEVFGRAHYRSGIYRRDIKAAIAPAVSASNGTSDQTSPDAGDDGTAPRRPRPGPQRLPTNTTSTEPNRDGSHLANNRNALQSEEDRPAYLGSPDRV